MSTDTVTVYGRTSFEVEVDPIAVLEKMDIGIPSGDWVIQDVNAYVHMEEVSAGQHSFNNVVKLVDKVTFDRFNARELLIKYLKSKRS